MALQDLTPQLRTRLSRMERAVGWFVFIATLMLAAGFVYYVYHVAQRKGWFLRKISYKTCVSSGAGLRVGDPVKLMGFDVGEITAIIPNDPYAYYNITVFFRVRAPNYGYIWSDSKVKVNAADFLGGRFLEVTKGVAGVPTVFESTNQNKEVLGVLREHFAEQVQAKRLQEMKKQDEEEVKKTGKAPEREADLLNQLLRELNRQARGPASTFYTKDFRQNIYFLDPIESAAIGDRLDKLVTQVENALPGILNLTNQLSTVLANSATLTSNLNSVAAIARPAVSNLALATAQLNQPGALGEWLLPTNLNLKLDAVLDGANTNLANLNLSLLNLADLTSNLNHQVQINTNMLGAISKAVMDADELMQGLKRHWLLRSAFKTKMTNAPAGALEPVVSPKDRSLR